MQTQNTITPQELQDLQSRGKTVHLLDVRTPAEHSSVHIPGTQLIPLDELDPISFCNQRGTDCSPVYVICQSGGRAARAIKKLETAGVTGCVLLQGGTQAWMDAGLPVNRGKSRVLPLMRQVQITIGTISASASLLALLFDPKFALVPLFMGCGLLIAGATGFCGLALLMAKMPWNKIPTKGAATCCSINA